MDEQAANTADPGPPAAGRAVLQVGRPALLAVFVVLLATVPLVSAEPWLFWWTPVLPILAGVWVLWARTMADEKGITIRLLRGSTTATWDQVDGVRFPPRGWGRLVRLDGSERPMPGVGFSDLRVLSRASGGRVPDPFAAAEQAREAREAEEVTDAE
ncbi:MAG: PH domain-containing protein [Mycobacteriaceae bacterium]